MVKKFFKALALGLLQCTEGLKALALLTWCPILVIVVVAVSMRILNIQVTEQLISSLLIGALAAFFIGVGITAFVIHCVDAMKYQEKHQCSFEEAWHATTSYSEF